MNTRYWNKTNLYRQVDALKKELQSLYVFNATGIDSKGLAYQCVNNLAIREIPFDNTKICGILYKGDRKTAIGLNVNRTPEMQNFDCMHELIHYFFHDICYCQCICSDEQSGEYIQQDRIQEWQANEGAAQFLVPYQDFIPRFTKLLNSGVTGVQSILAEYYNVTTQVIILHAENICSNSSGNWTAFGNCGKGVFPNWYKVMEKLDALAYKAVNILFVISICVADDGINFLLEGSKVTIVFCGQLPLDKFPKTFYQVEIWAVWWNVFEVDAQLPGKIPHDLAFLVPCVVKHQVDFLLPIRCRNLAQHGAYFCGGYVAVICHNQYFLGNIVHGPKDVMAHPARERHDKTPCPAVDTPKETAAHDKVGGIQEQQGNIPLLRLFH